MPTGSMTRCPAPGCTALVPRGYCPEHARPAWANKPSSWSRGAGDARWRRLRARVLREEPRCRACGAPSTEADHIRPISLQGARWDRANLQGLCKACHKVKTQRESINARRARGRESRSRRGAP